MTYTLLIVESPAKCQKIENFLGPGYKVIGSFGHITHLSNLKQIDFKNNYKLNFDIIESKQNQINKIKKAINNANEIILATDDDREGEAIAWHIVQVFKLDLIKTKRIVFNEITERAIKNALKNPVTININLVYAQQARQILDLLVGFKISPLLWSHITSNTKNSLSAGRCQTPALKLVYDNYCEINNSPGKLSFNTNGFFTSKNICFTLNNNHNSHEDMNNFLELSKDFKHILSHDSEKNVTKSPPTPFTTSSLQQAANNNMHISPKETMSLAQKLYEGGYITYMRTDSKVYSEEFIDKVKTYIEKNYNDEYISKNIQNLIQKLSNENDETNKLTVENKKESKKISKKKEKENLAQEAHEAIRPTNISIESIPDDEDVYTSKHRRLYKIIWKNTLESLMSDAIYNQLVIKITAPNELFYKYTSEENIFPGWKVLEGVDSDKFYTYLKNINNGKITYRKITSKQTLKDLKLHYTEAKLVQLLENKGIGRPSTFSTLIDKIQERNYVKKENVSGKKIEIIDYSLENNIISTEKGEKEFGNEKNKLVITQTGIFVIEFLIKYFNDLFNYDYTKIMESELDLIANGKKEYYTLCDECNSLIESLITSNSLVKNSNSVQVEKLNIKIDENHSYIIGKNGPVIKYNKPDGSLGFYGVKANIDIEKLKNCEYKLEEIIQTKDDNNKLLGLYKNKEVYLKIGKFGYYLEYGDIKKSLKSVKINIPFKNITLEDAINILENMDENINSLVRKIDDNISIRKGKYGDYIFYKTEKMTRPKFYKLNGFDGDYKTCTLLAIKLWLKDTYSI
jgi:DNA topoisomerase-1